MSNDPNDWSQVTPVIGLLTTWMSQTYLDIKTEDDAHQGTGSTGGQPGLGLPEGTVFKGVMGFSNWETLKSAPNEFHIFGGTTGAFLGGFGILLKINGEIVGVIGVVAVGVALAIGTSGTLTWT
jgi:hypothetical protein